MSVCRRLSILLEIRCDVLAVYETIFALPHSVVAVAAGNAKPVRD
jgi:hypothetical protein